MPMLLVCMSTACHPLSSNSLPNNTCWRPQCSIALPSLLKQPVVQILDMKRGSIKFPWTSFFSDLSCFIWNLERQTNCSNQFYLNIKISTSSKYFQQILPLKWIRSFPVKQNFDNLHLMKQLYCKGLHPSDPDLQVRNKKLQGYFKNKCFSL